MNFINAIKLLAAFCCTAILVACGGGGGGGSPELIPGHALPNALYSTAPSAVTIALGAAPTFSVGGGTPFYSASSSNPGVATAAISGSTLTITSVAAGSAQITVFDAIGSSVSTTVTVGSGAVATITPLFATVPSAVTLAAGAAASYTIGGGVPPYLQSSSNTGVATAAVNGTTLTINGVASGAAQVSVFDSTGSSLQVSVNVGSSAVTALYMTAPSSITSLPGAASSFTIGGGRAPYTVSSSNAGVAVASVGGASTLAIASLAAGTAQIVVFDASGASVSTTLSVVAASGPATTPLYVAAPGAVNLEVAAASTYGISGGTAPYSVSSSNVSVASASVSAASFTVTGIKAGAAQVIVFDAVGQSATVNVTIGAGGSVASVPLFTTAPMAVTLASGAAASSYSIGGGTPPYSVSSSNASVVTATGSDSTSLHLTSVAAGSATVVISDSVGTKLEIAVTVTATTITPTPLAVLPSSATANVGDVLSFGISGGSGSYSSVTVQNASIASVSASSAGTYSDHLSPVSGANFYVKLLNVGNTTVAIVDSLGQTATLTLTVNIRSSTLGLSPSAIQVSEGSSAPIALNIYGGSAPYTALTDDSLLTGVSITGTAALPTLMIGLGSNGNRCITPYDSPSLPHLYVANGIYNVTLTVVDSLGASATSTLSIKDDGLGEFSTACADMTVIVSPAAATNIVGSVLTFTINGGLPNYIITSGNTAIATVTPSLVTTNGGTFTATLVAVGSTTVTIMDSLGATTTVTLNVI